MASRKAIEEPKNKVVKSVPVRILTAKGVSALVEWFEKDAPKRGFVPVTAVTDGSVSADVLDVAIPYGLDFTLLSLPKVTSLDLQNALHNQGVWTIEDVRFKRQNIQAAIQDVTSGPILAVLMQSIKGK